MTTFVAKGLEFNTVIIPGFNEGLVPYVRAGPVPGAAWWVEKRREMYVAVTRTEDQLYLMVRAGRPASRFLQELGVREG
jgi:DNA helicase-2/ATP-dependent DNA helicase PcrA